MELAMTDIILVTAV